MTDQECTFSSPGTVQPPTQRIRELEEKLRHSSTRIAELESRDVHFHRDEINFLTQEAPRADRRSKDSSLGERLEMSRQGVSNMMGCRGQFIQRADGAKCYLGPSSSLSLTLRILDLFPKTPEVSTSPNSVRSAILNIASHPAISETCGRSGHGNKLDSLPSQATTVRMLESVLSQCSLAAQFLGREDLGRVVEAVYTAPSSRHESQHERQVILIHSWLALAYLYHLPVHQAQGCKQSHDAASYHFEIARSATNTVRCDDILSLQILLSITIFLLVTSRITTAQSFVSIAYSMSIRQGFHVLSWDSGLPDALQIIQLRAFVTLLQIDTYVGFVLGLPSCSNGQKFWGLRKQNSLHTYVNSGTVHRGHTALMDLSLMSLDLFAITTSGLEVAFSYPFPDSSATQITESNEILVDTDRLDRISIEFKQWFDRFTHLCKRAKDVWEDTSFACELELMYYSCQTVVYQPFLHHLKTIADGRTSRRSQSRHALACIKIASITICRSEAIFKRGLMRSASWSSIYTIFQAVISLVFLIAAHGGTSKPSEAWKMARRGIRLLATVRCWHDCATSCLSVLKVLVSELSHTVDFDIDQIEFSTARLCQYSLSHERTDSTANLTIVEDRSWVHEVDHLSQPITDGHQLTSSPGTVVSGIVGARRTGDAYEFNETLRIHCDADEILAQAQRMSLDIGSTRAV